MHKLTIILELMRIMESAFIYKLKKKNSAISNEDLSKSIVSWYRDKPIMTLPNCTKGDISRFS